MPWGSYRMVAQEPDRSVLVTAYFGETVEQDDVALQIGQAALDQLRQG